MTTTTETIDRVRRPKEAATILGCSTRTLARIPPAELPRTQVSERCFGYRDSVLNEFIKSRTA